MAKNKENTSSDAKKVEIRETEHEIDVFMEFVAWSNHRYLMHEALRRWHKDHHHRPKTKKDFHMYMDY